MNEAGERAAHGLLRSSAVVGAMTMLSRVLGLARDVVLAAFVGTGIGGCVIRDGRIVKGVTGNAGEIGHLIVKANFGLMVLIVTATRPRRGDI